MWCEQVQKMPLDHARNAVFLSLPGNAPNVFFLPEATNVAEATVSEATDSPFPHVIRMNR